MYKINIEGVMSVNMSSLGRENNFRRLPLLSFPDLLVPKPLRAHHMIEKCWNHHSPQKFR